MTALELQRLERAIRKAVTAILEREMPILTHRRNFLDGPCFPGWDAGLLGQPAVGDLCWAVETIASTFVTSRMPELDAACLTTPN